MVHFQLDYTSMKLERVVINESKKKEFDHLAEHLAKTYEALIHQLGEDKVVKKTSEDPLVKEAEDQEIQEKKKKRTVPKSYYYHPASSRATYSFHVYTPGGIEITRVPANILGPNVLGRAFIGTNKVEILETLSGLQFEEVKRHEVNHILNPYLGEMEIRQKTRAELPFDPYFH